MTQKERVKRALLSGAKHITEIAEETDILLPNVRRIVGVGAKEGEMVRIDRGVYILNIDGKDAAYVQCADAAQALPRLAALGWKFDMVFLDPAYFSKQLIGGNRKPIKYDFIHPGEFDKVIESAGKLLRTDDSHLYLMLSGAGSAYNDMLKYVNASMMLNGLHMIGQGEYKKLNKDGSFVTNIRGREAAAERILLFTKSGRLRDGEQPVKYSFEFLRPHISKSYPTEKPQELMAEIILQSTFEGDIILDPFAGSGVTGEQAVRHGRRVYLIDKSAGAVQNFIIPRLRAA